MQRWTWLALALVIGCGSAPAEGVDGGTAHDAGDPTGDGGVPADASPAGPTIVQLTLANRPNNAAAYSFVVAFQDGAAPWQLAPAPTGDTYALPIHAPSYGVAWTCISGGTGNTQSGQLREVTTAHFAASERTQLTLDIPGRCSDRGPATVTLSGSVTSRPIGGVLVVQYGDRNAFVSATTGSYSLATPPGTRDLIVSHAVSRGGGDYYVERVAVVRDVVVNGATTRSVNFNTSAQTVSYPVTAQVGTSRVLAATTLTTANRTVAGLIRETSQLASVALATAHRRTSDVYDQTITVSTFGRSATVSRLTSSPSAQTYVAPTAIGAPMTAIPTKDPYVRVETTWQSYAGASGYVWTATQTPGSFLCGGTACTITWRALLSPGVTGMSPGYLMPDLAGLAGWKPGWQLVSSVPVTGSVQALTSSAGAADFPLGPPTDGLLRTTSRADFTVTP
jgi:hypothetical protein